MNRPASCHRCGRQRVVGSELCQGCRAFLLGDRAVDPAGQPPTEDRVVTDDPAAWARFRWGPLVDLREPEDLAFVRRPDGRPAADRQ